MPEKAAKNEDTFFLQILRNSHNTQKETALRQTSPFLSSVSTCLIDFYDKCFSNFNQSHTSDIDYEDYRNVCNLSIQIIIVIDKIIEVLNNEDQLKFQLNELFLRLNAFAEFLEQITNIDISNFFISTWQQPDGEIGLPIDKSQEDLLLTTLNKLSDITTLSPA